MGGQHTLNRSSSRNLPSKHTMIVICFVQLKELRSIKILPWGWKTVITKKSTKKPNQSNSCDKKTVYSLLNISEDLNSLEAIGAARPVTSHENLRKFAVHICKSHVRSVR